jgi:pimeloyl-ACP methyl ester carboxylesterase
MTDAYAPRRPACSRFVDVRGLRYHVHAWSEPSEAQPPLVMLHGWMDVGASFQFVVDAMAGDRCVIAPDWRGFGNSAAPTIWGTWTRCSTRSRRRGRWTSRATAWAATSQ